MSISATINRGKNTGTKIMPHLYRDGHYVVSLTRFKRDQIPVHTLAEVRVYLLKGFSLRMSNPKEGVAQPSLIVASKISF